MGLTNEREEQLKKMPIIESKVSKSKDGRFIIQRTVFTTIKPVAYFDKILSTNGTEEVEAEQ
jgi:hypothetical protein